MQVDKSTLSDEIYRFAKKRQLLRCTSEIIILIYEGKDLPFDLWRQTKYPRTQNVFCTINCIVCQQSTRVSTKDLQKRIMVLEEICLPCGKYEIYKRAEWKKANSDAQKKIQSTPEQKRKNSQGVSNFWKNNPEKKESVRQKLLQFYEDPKNKEKWLKTISGKSNSKALSGSYYFRKKSWIDFNSAYELCFLVWAEAVSEISTIRSCKFNIPYTYLSRQHHYLPDYLIFKDNKKIIVEIKSTENVFYKEDKNVQKVIATKKFIKEMNYDDYWFIDEDEANRIGLKFRRTSGVKSLCKQLYAESKLKIFCKKKLKSYVGIKDETT